MLYPSRTSLDLVETFDGLTFLLMDDSLEQSRLLNVVELKM